jgi:hypothetical protein
MVVAYVEGVSLNACAHVVGDSLAPAVACRVGAGVFRRTAASWLRKLLLGVQRAQRSVLHGHLDDSREILTKNRGKASFGANIFFGCWPLLRPRIHWAAEPRAALQIVCPDQAGYHRCCGRSTSRWWLRLAIAEFRHTNFFASTQRLWFRVAARQSISRDWICVADLASGHHASICESVCRAGGLLSAGRCWHRRCAQGAPGTVQRYLGEQMQRKRSLVPVAAAAGGGIQAIWHARPRPSCNCCDQGRRYHMRCLAVYCGSDGCA